VVVWDFDDTLVPWYRMKRSASSSGKDIFQQWFDYNQAIQKEHLDGRNPSWESAMCLPDLPGNVQSKVRRAYSQSRDALLPRANCTSLEATTESMYSNWMRVARGVLSDVEARGGINVLLTAAPLCAAYAKCLVFGFSRFFQVDHIYSANEDSSGKYKTMDAATRMAEKSCGPKGAKFVSCGDGSAEEKAAQKLRIPHVHAASQASLAGVLRYS